MTEAVPHLIKTKPLISDPRVFFAAERTLLAWVRSGLAVMALGLVINKFGLLLSAITNITHQPPHRDSSHFLGIALVIVGTLIVIGAQYNHQAYLRFLPSEDVPKQSIARLDLFLTVSIAIIGILLTVYLF